MIVKNIAMLGHKDHGKSTLIGSLLIATGAATQARVKEAQEYSKKLNKKFEPAFILDSFEEERSGGLTIDTTRAETKYKDMAFEFIDVPGHEELIQNMMSGVSYANIGILVVSAKSDEGIRDQTKRHVFVARMLGIEKLVIAVNKMDTIKYNEERFNSIKKSIEQFLFATGFKRSDFSFVPISAYNSENLIKKSNKTKWYKGKPLLESVYALSKSRSKNISRNFRATVQGYIDANDKELIATRILSGSARKGQEIEIFPTGNKSTIKSITIRGKAAASAGIGTSAAIKLSSVLKNPRGIVLSSGKPPVVSNDIKAVIFATLPISAKSELEIKLSSEEAKCKSIEIKNIIDTTTGLPSQSKAVEPLNAAKVSLLLDKKIVVERYADLKSLGRFTIYSKGKFAGIGIVE
jgi:bifunctional enzyme CysN/CysC/sulfate adenylyltransferase subunit 1